MSLIHCSSTDVAVFTMHLSVDKPGSNPCSNSYCGPSSGSEAETEAINNDVQRLADRIRGYVTLHTYGQMWMLKSCEHTDETVRRNICLHHTGVLDSDIPRLWSLNFKIYAEVNLNS